MFSANKKPQIKCWTGPASPQWGLKTNVFIPLALLYYENMIVQLWIEKSKFEKMDRTFWTGSKRTYWRRRNRRNKHTVDFQRLSILPE